MSFDLYFAGTQNELCHQYLMDRNLCRLQSQLNDRSQISKWVSKKPHGKLFIDSGAYTSYTKGVDLDVNAYIDYVNSIDEDITIYAQVDKIPGTHGQPKTLEEITEAPVMSWENFLYMRQRVVCKDKLIPTFHQTEPLKYLKNILEFEDAFGKIQYFALGAMANVLDQTSRANFLSSCFTTILSIRPDIKVHAFGMTDLTLLELFPFYSADSTTYTIAAGMGEIITKFGRIAVSSLRRNSNRYLLNTKQEYELLQDYVASFGYDLDVLAESRNERVKFNISYLQDWEKHRICRYNKIAKSHKLF